MTEMGPIQPVDWSVKVGADAVEIRAEFLEDGPDLKN